MNFKIFLIIFFSGLIFSARAQLKQIRFNNLNINHGLSFNTVTSIIKDKRGVMWFGTQDGLNKYDGYKFQIYKTHGKIPNSISHNDILTIYEDRKGNLWIGTNGGGLCQYDRSSDSFISYKYQLEDPTTISNNAVTCIYEDNQGNLWVGTYYGLNIFDRATKKFKRFVNYNNEKYLSSNSISSIAEDLSGNLWVSTFDNGLNIFDRKTYQAVVFNHSNTDRSSIASNSISKLLVDKKGNLWIGTSDKGLDLFIEESRSFKHFVHNPRNDKSLSGNGINVLEEDEYGNLWIGIEAKGLNHFNVKDHTVSRYFRDPSDPNAIISNSIRDIFLDNLGILWIGTYAGGISLHDKYRPAFFYYRPNIRTNTINTLAETPDGRIWAGTDGDGFCSFTRKGSRFKQYKRDSSIKNTLSNSGVISLITDHTGKLWIGTYGGGISIFDPKTENFSFIEAGEGKKKLSNDKIYALYEDKNRNVWIGTLGGGLNVWDRKTSEIKRYEHHDEDWNSISNNYISSIVEDKDGNIWIGTYGSGINLYNKEKDNFTFYSHNTSNIGTAIVNTLFVDSKNNLWVGTMGGGLKLFDKEKESFTTYNTSDGLADDAVNGIEEDQHGNLWISTNRGIAKFNIKDKSFSNYSVYEGLQSHEFRKGASLRTSSGEILFGGIYGFNLFHPDSIKENPNKPEIILTDFQIFNKPVKIGRNSVLKSHISETKEITLNHSQSVFTIGFAALNYTLPEKNRYSYKLEGFDKEWNDAGAERKATYTNLNPGEYVFRVKASNNSGVWNNEGISLKIFIKPPFWKTWWFYLLLIFATLFLIFLWIKIRTNALRKRQKMLESEVQKRTEELRLVNVELMLQKEELSIQTKYLEEAYKANKAQGEKIQSLYHEVTDSIRAAKELQSSILPSLDHMKKYLCEHFVLYKPKDVVSGDFYWFDVKDDKCILAAVDCTGHGVSGAFMSISAHHLLKQAIGLEGCLVASEILDRLNEGIIRELHQRENDLLGNDGLDIGLCIIDQKSKVLQFSGANHPLYILRNNEIIQIKGDRFSIGATIQKIQGKIKKYTNHEVQLQDGDVVYMFSDGFADQIGGQKGDEKFLYNRFRDLLTNIGLKEMHEQMGILEEEFTKWKGANEQLDDVLVMGFKV